MNQVFIFWWSAFFLAAAFLLFFLSPWWSGVALLLGAAGLGAAFLLSLQKELRTSLSPGARMLGFDRYVSDITHVDVTSYKETSLVGRKEEFQAVEIMVGRPEKKSVLVVGDPGIGKSVFLYAVVRALRKRHGRNVALAAPSFFVMDLEKAFGEAVGSGTEKEHFVRALFEEMAVRGRAVVIVENAEQCLGSSALHNLSRLLCQYAGHPKLSLLLSLRPEAYYETASQNELSSAFETLFLRAPNREEALEIVQNHFQSLSKKKEFLTPGGKQAWFEAVDRLGDRLPGAHHEKIIRFGEELVLFWMASGEAFITEETVKAFLKEQTLLASEVEGRPSLGFRNLPEQAWPVPPLTAGMKPRDIS